MKTLQLKMLVTDKKRFLEFVLIERSGRIKNCIFQHPTLVIVITLTGDRLITPNFLLVTT